MHGLFPAAREPVFLSSTRAGDAAHVLAAPVPGAFLEQCPFPLMAARGPPEGGVEQCLQLGSWPLEGISGCTGGRSCSWAATILDMSRMVCIEVL